MTLYEIKVSNRSLLRLTAGFFARVLSWLRIRIKVRKMRRFGAKVALPIGIGRSIVLPASSNLIIGGHCSFQSSHIDVRSPVKFGENVIVGDGVRIITSSHDIDSPNWDFKSYGIEIDDYVWLATKAMILPSCRHIGRGAVVGAGSVVVNNVPPMAVVSGNPARIIRYRKCVHDSRVVEELQGGDIAAYCAVALRRLKNIFHK